MPDNELVDAWEVEWQTEAMAAPAFWYYHSHREALTDAALWQRAMPGTTRTRVGRTRVPADTKFCDEKVTA